ncbi:MAG: ImmA/IrrE family metallo-endopeptidase [Ruminococcus sp.]|nr:ImmA/IrrE family metallo-endopeptidase [Ruminococcus sp.]
MNIKKAAKQFVKECNYKDLSFKSLKTALQKLGFGLVRFNQFDTDKIAELSHLMKIPVSQFEKMAFTYDLNNVKTIYVREFISEKDFATLVLHEIGHILLGHTKDQHNIYTSDVQQESEANAFALYAIDYIQNHNKKSSVIKKVSLPLTLLSCTLIITVAMLIIPYRLNSKSNDISSSALLSQADATEDLSSVTEKITKKEQTTTTTPKTTLSTSTTTPATPAEKSVTNDTNDIEVFYITKTGKKYHLQGCRHIVGRDVIEGTKEDFEKVGYEPCADCIGDK